MQHERRVFKSNWGSACVKEILICVLEPNLKLINVRTKSKQQEDLQQCYRPPSRSDFNICSMDRCSPEWKQTLTNEPDASRNRCSSVTASLTKTITPKNYGIGRNLLFVIFATSYNCSILAGICSNTSY